VLDAARRRVEIGVLPDENVPFFQPQPDQRLQAVRPYAQLLPQFQQRTPQRQGMFGRVVQFVRQLAGEAEAEDVAGHILPPRLCCAPASRADCLVPALASSCLANGPVTLIAPRDIVWCRMRTSRPQLAAQSRSHISAWLTPPLVKVRV
jgi:hypothetical protein